MIFKKFTIMDSKESHIIDDGEITILFNLNHIVSIKPIKINRPDRVINGYWIRTTNGKKYKATAIPSELEEMIGEIKNPIFMNDEIGVENQLQ